MFNLEGLVAKVMAFSLQDVGTSIMLALLFFALRISRKILDFSTAIFGYLYYGIEAKRIPSIKDAVLTKSAGELAEMIRNRKIASEEVVRIYIDRIRSVNALINAVNENHFVDALTLAAEADNYIETSGEPPETIGKTKPLLGVPVSIKNSLSVKGWVWDTGCEARRNKKGTETSPSVQLLIDAGAIPIVLTNVPELCMWLDSYNTIHGTTYNPYDLSRVPGGSSGGEAALIAAAGSVLGLGNDIGGSLRLPAFFCGIYSHKPTTGLVSTELMHPAPGVETGAYAAAGPLCRYVSDLSLSMKILTGKKAASLNFDKEVEFSNVKFYYVTEIDYPLASSVQPEIKRATERAAFHFKNKYCSSVERLNLPVLSTAFITWMTAMRSGDNPTFAELMTDFNGDANPYRELTLWLLRQPRHTLPIILLSLLERTTPPKDSPRYKDFLRNLDTMKDIFQELFERGNENVVLLMPPYPEVAPFHNETISKSINCGYCFPFNLTGYPVTTCPAGRGKDNLPIGVQIASGPNRDFLTLRVAEELDGVFGGWSAP